MRSSVEAGPNKQVASAASLLPEAGAVSSTQGFFMSYPYGTPGTPQPTSSTYPYGAYAPGHPYPYQSPSPYHQAWAAYPYSYTAPHTPPQTAQPRPPVASTSSTPLPQPVQSTPQTQTTSYAPQSTPRTGTFTSYTPSYARERESSVTPSVAPSTGGRGGKKATTKGLFTKELKNLMYGFGDDRNPATDTVNVMEEILIEYITDVCQVAGGPTRKSRLSVEDLRRALSRPEDAKKLARMEELLFMQEDIKRARKQFEENDMNSKAF